MKLSVIIPNYNHARYLPESLDAILAQSYPASEVIIVDDASTDSSIKVITEYQLRYPQIRLYQNEKNQGPVPTINRSVGYAAGEYLVFCAADDRVLPGLFERLVGFLDRHPETAFCTSDSRYFKEDGSFHDATCEELGRNEKIIYPEDLVQILRTTRFSIPTHTSLYRREQFIKYGGLNNKLKMVCDFYLNYRIALHAPIGYVPEVLASLRQVEGSYSAKIFSEKKKWEEVFRSFFEEIDREPSEVRSRFVRSSLLSLLGLKMFMCLVKNRSRWEFLTPILRNKFKGMVINKLKNYAKRRP